MGFFDRAKERAEEAAKKAKPLAEQFKEKAKPVAATLKDKAEHAAKSAKNSAEAFREGRHGDDKTDGKAEAPQAADETKPTDIPPPAT